MNLLLVGGGTGGHVYPALAVAEAAQSIATVPSRVEFAGDPKGLEYDLVTRAGYPFHTAPGPDVSGLPRKWSLSSLIGLGKLILRVPLSIRLLRELRPEVVIGTGGYVSASLLYAATLLHIPTIMLDLNALPGRTTRWLSRRLSRIAISFEQARQYLPENKVVFTGCPVRRAIYETDTRTARSELGIGDAEKMALVFGGSQAAHTINLATFGAVETLLNDFEKLHLWHLCGERDLAAAEETKASLAFERRHRYHPLPYCHTMELLIAASDLSISRAGGASIGELTARGLPAILVPYPYATDNHQEANARAVESVGGAKAIRDSDFDASAFITEAGRLLRDDPLLAAMREASLQFGRRDAALQIIQLAQSLI